MQRPRNNPENPRSLPERLQDWWMKFLDGAHPPSDALLRQRQHTRRRLSALGGLAALGILAVAVANQNTQDNEGCGTKKEIPEVVEPPEPAEASNRIEFFGKTIEIADEDRFKAKREMAQQYLVLKFSTPGKVPGDDGKLRDEEKEEYWKRAIEGEFRDVLIEMDRYRPFIEERAAALGVDPDVLAFFGIEAGFNPLKRSPTGYCGLGQVGEAAVKDVKTKTDAFYKIEKEGINPDGDWYDLRYDPLYGIDNGIAYIGHLEKEFPATVQDLVKKWTDGTEKWLLVEVDTEKKQTRLDQIEVQVGLPKGSGTPRERYEAVLANILPDGDVRIADPASFAIHSYNMGPTGVARLVFLNFVHAKANGYSLLETGPNGGRISSFQLGDEASLTGAMGLDKATETPEAEQEQGDSPPLYGIDVDMSHPLRTTDSPQAREERGTYLWQAYVFSQLAKQWAALPPGGTLEIPFATRLKGLTFSLKKPDAAPQPYTEMMKTMVEIEVPAGLDVVRLAEHLKLDDRVHSDPGKIDHHEAFRLKGNAAFVRGGAYGGNPQKRVHREGTVSIKIPREKAAQARTFLAEQGAAAITHLYKVQSRDSADKIMKKLRAANPEVAEDRLTKNRIFWEYNRFGYARQSNLDGGEWLVLPSDLRPPG